MAERRRNRAAAAAAAAAGALFALAPSAQAGSVPPSVKLSPLDGAHWQGQQGVISQDAPDVRDVGVQGLVGPRLGGPNIRVAALSGFEGRLMSSLAAFGFAAYLPSGIIPCVRVGFLNTAGVENFIEVEPGSRTGAGLTPELINDRPGWVQFTFNGELPEGTITGITLNTEPSNINADPPNITPVRFDNVSVTFGDGSTYLWGSANDQVQR